MKHTPRSQGFSLLEALVCIAIISMAVILLSGRMNIHSSEIKQQANLILKAFNRARTESLYTGRPIRISIRSNHIVVETYNKKSTWEKIPATEIQLVKNSNLCILNQIKGCTTNLRNREAKPHYIYFNRHLPPAAMKLKLTNKTSKRTLIIQMNSFGDTSIQNIGSAS